MIIETDRSGGVKELEELLERVSSRPGVEGLLVLACGENGFTPEDLNPLLWRQNLPLAGGIFPAILRGAEKLERGTIVAGLGAPLRTLVVPGLSDPDIDFTRHLEEALEIEGPSPPGLDAPTVLVLLDGLARRIEPFVEALYGLLGIGRTYLGGGAGTLAMDRSPMIICNQGLLADAALVGFLDVPSSLGVSHGWNPVAGPFRVTSSRGTTVETLDWKPAFQVYRQVLERLGVHSIDPEDFFAASRSYPFGIARVGAERVVRDPYQLHPDGSLTCVGAVRQGSFVHILHGDRHSLVSAAAEARRISQRFQPGPGGTRLFFDCISRVLFLKECYAEELSAVHDPLQPLVGACSIGEIANNGHSYLEFYNMTSVVADLAADLAEVQPIPDRQEHEP
ncbi:FIST N domain-containing protein [Alkalispirochaeta americana]|uniref:FIST N domain-containing protein n=1 Tax=Alkalispirochaeta americana TaxID=159291 RepID=A0A1N6S175_9SPIO|nr:FIST C-terminal domain-containing protein [Alkalispirochaeta americana]SIQ34799.1 FIST N domain-containing protein [Alkalispirochaeta americana]